MSAKYTVPKSIIMNDKFYSTIRKKLMTGVYLCPEASSDIDWLLRNGLKLSRKNRILHKKVLANVEALLRTLNDGSTSIKGRHIKHINCLISNLEKFTSIEIEETQGGEGDF